MPGDDEHVIVADQDGRAVEGNKLPPSPQVGCLLQLDNFTLATFDVSYIYIRFTQQSVFYGLNAAGDVNMGNLACYAS